MGVGRSKHSNAKPAKADAPTSAAVAAQRSQSDDRATKPAAVQTPPAAQAPPAAKPAATTSTTTATTTTTTTTATSTTAKPAQAATSTAASRPAAAASSSAASSSSVKVASPPPEQIVAPTKAQLDKIAELIRWSLNPDEDFRYQASEDLQTMLREEKQLGFAPETEGQIIEMMLRLIVDETATVLSQAGAVMPSVCDRLSPYALFFVLHELMGRATKGTLERRADATALIYDIFRALRVRPASSDAVALACVQPSLQQLTVQQQSAQQQSAQQQNLWKIVSGAVERFGAAALLTSGGGDASALQPPSRWSLAGEAGAPPQPVASDAADVDRTLLAIALRMVDGGEAGSEAEFACLLNVLPTYVRVCSDESFGQLMQRLLNDDDDRLLKLHVQGLEAVGRSSASRVAPFFDKIMAFCIARLNSEQFDDYEARAQCLRAITSVAACLPHRLEPFYADLFAVGVAALTFDPNAFDDASPQDTSAVTAVVDDDDDDDDDEWGDGGAGGGGDDNDNEQTKQLLQTDDDEAWKVRQGGASLLAMLCATAHLPELIRGAGAAILQRFCERNERALLELFALISALAKNCRSSADRQLLLELVPRLTAKLVQKLADKRLALPARSASTGVLGELLAVADDAVEQALLDDAIEQTLAALEDGITALLSPLLELLLKLLRSCASLRVGQHSTSALAVLCSFAQPSQLSHIPGVSRCVAQLVRRARHEQVDVAQLARDVAPFAQWICANAPKPIDRRIKQAAVECAGVLLALGAALPCYEALLHCILVELLDSELSRGDALLVAEKLQTPVPAALLARCVQLLLPLTRHSRSIKISALQALLNLLQLAGDDAALLACFADCGASLRHSLQDADAQAVGLALQVVARLLRATALLDAELDAVVAALVQLARCERLRRGSAERLALDDCLRAVNAKRSSGIDALIAALLAAGTGDDEPQAIGDLHAVASSIAALCSDAPAVAAAQLAKFVQRAAGRGGDSRAACLDLLAVGELCCVDDCQPDEALLDIVERRFAGEREAEASAAAVCFGKLCAVQPQRYLPAVMAHLQQPERQYLCLQAFDAMTDSAALLARRLSGEQAEQLVERLLSVSAEQSDGQRGLIAAVLARLLSAQPSPSLFELLARSAAAEAPGVRATVLLCLRAALTLSPGPLDALLDQQLSTVWQRIDDGELLVKRAALACLLTCLQRSPQRLLGAVARDIQAALAPLARKNPAWVLVTKIGPVTKVEDLGAPLRNLVADALAGFLGAADQLDMQLFVDTLLCGFADSEPQVRSTSFATCTLLLSKRMQFALVVQSVPRFVDALSAALREQLKAQSVSALDSEEIVAERNLESTRAALRLLVALQAADPSPAVASLVDFVRGTAHAALLNKIGQESA